jgi:hypothetical protein
MPQHKKLKQTQNPCCLSGLADIERNIFSEANFSSNNFAILRGYATGYATGYAIHDMCPVMCLISLPFEHFLL